MQNESKDHRKAKGSRQNVGLHIKNPVTGPDYYCI